MQKYSILVPHYSAVVYVMIYGFMVPCISKTFILRNIAVAYVLKFSHSNNYTTFGTQYNSNYIDLFNTFPFRSKTEFLFSLIHLLPFILFPFLFSSIQAVFANHETRLQWKNRIGSLVASWMCNASSLLGSNRNEKFSCPLQHRRASWTAVSKIDHVYKQWFRKENCRRDEG